MGTLAKQTHPLCDLRSRSHALCIYRHYIGIPYFQSVVTITMTTCKLYVQFSTRTMYIRVEAQSIAPEIESARIYSYMGPEIGMAEYKWYNIVIVTRSRFARVGIGRVWSSQSNITIRRTYAY